MCTAGISLSDVVSEIQRVYATVGNQRTISWRAIALLNRNLLVAGGHCHVQSRLPAAGTKHIQRRYCRYFVTAYTEGKMTPTGTTPLPCTIEHHVQCLKIMQARQHSSLVMNVTGYSWGAGGCSESNVPCAQMLRTRRQGAASLCCDLQSDRVKLPESGKLNAKVSCAQMARTLRRLRSGCPLCAATWPPLSAQHCTALFRQSLWSLLWPPPTSPNLGTTSATMPCSYSGA